MTQAEIRMKYSFRLHKTWSLAIVPQDAYISHSFRQLWTFMTELADGVLRYGKAALFMAIYAFVKPISKC
jgi:hypothetical protein